MTLNKLHVDCSTNEIKLIPLTAQEISDLDQMRAKIEEDRTAAAEEAEILKELKASAKAKLIAGQPLTEDEAATLVI